MTITPEMLAKVGSESAHQKALFCWMALPEQKARYPELDLAFHIPNGGARDSDQKVAAKRGGELKAEGVKSGVLDIFLPVARGGWHGLFLELKVKNNTTSEKQDKFIFRVTQQGFLAKVCYSWVAAKTALEEYLCP